MQIIGFNFTKILAERPEKIEKSQINTNIEFTDLNKEKLDLFKESDAMKIAFTLTISYKNEDDSKTKDFPKLEFKGYLVLSVSSEEMKQIQKSWKKKEIPPSIQIPLYNFILKKSSAKSLSLQEELNIPSHIPIPQIRPQQRQD